MVNVPLGRESDLFVVVQREKSVTFMKKAAHPRTACDMKREKNLLCKALAMAAHVLNKKSSMK